jgi:hypothetical protein
VKLLKKSAPATHDLNRPALRVKTIGIRAESLSPGLQATFDALGEALGVSFVRSRFEDSGNVDGWIVLAADRQMMSHAALLPKPCYVVPGDAELTACGSRATIACADSPHVDPVLRGRSVEADDAIDAKALPAWLRHVQPSALKGDATVWATDARGGIRHEYVSLAPPELSDGDALFQHLGGRRMARLLPLALFVRDIVEAGWEPPALRATFMFDDPNLHWTSYGFIDYSEMVAQATAGNYHVSVATIPLDAWFTHQPAIDIFKNNSSRISLLVHGNDHLHRELARRQAPEAMQRLLEQAIGRIAAMERRSGLHVARVMAPPHGACSEVALSRMADAGFESVCVSRGSLRHHNADARWTRTVGMKPANIAAGIPVIPRFGLAQNCHNDILVAALLRQPIVPMTHHQSVAAGWGLLNDTAAFINSLGAVQWSDMHTISRSLYSHRCEDGVMSLRMWSRRIDVRVPDGVHELRVEPASQQRSGDAPLYWRAHGAATTWSIAPSTGSVVVSPGATIEIASGNAHAARVRPRSGAPRLAAVARRLLTEARDRALPSIQRIAQR